jgi:hypothetical protein
LKLKLHKLLSTFAFNLNLRRHIKDRALKPVEEWTFPAQGRGEPRGGGASGGRGGAAYCQPDGAALTTSAFCQKLGITKMEHDAEVGRCRLSVSNPS